MLPQMLLFGAADSVVANLVGAAADALANGDTRLQQTTPSTHTSPASQQSLPHADWSDVHPHDPSGEQVVTFLPQQIFWQMADGAEQH